MSKMQFNVESYIKLKNRIDELEKENKNNILLIDSKINKIIDALAWWIPFKKLRSKFREKFLIQILTKY